MPWDAGSLALAHVGDELGIVHIVVLLGVGLAANVVLLAPRVFGLFVKGPLTRALHEVAGPGARFGSITLPLRGSMSVEEVELPGLPEIARVEVEVGLLGLRQDPVTIPRIVLIRAPREEGSPEPVSVGEPDSTGGRAEAGSDARRYEVGAILVRDGGPDDSDSDEPAPSIDDGAIAMDAPGRPVDLADLVRHVIREVGAA